MKKHPVDDLFKRKLSDLEKQPSNMAWSRIQSEQKAVKKRFAAWIWYAAASVTIVLISGYLVWKVQNSDAQKYTSEKTVAQIETPGRIKIKATSLDSIAGSVLITEEKQIALVDNKITIRTQRKGKAVGKDSNSDLHKSEFHYDADKLNTGTDQIANVPLKNIPVEMPESAISPNFEKEIIPVSGLAAMNEKAENRTIVVHVDTDNSNEKSKPSRFAKVFRQLKNARAGEPVDWKDVGFSPKVIVARVDEKLRDKEEVISEKYQNIKERTKL
ncbi:hypothetical protein [Dyadobacter sp. NIV53]|uniref:hypothetical protein n=1 Tax=Dyadobacter sp. NIV53 TaxID=2861765 RepID=UPI001C870BFB|nr:hypothetical protein [Dyadobacter sp. NIV53]